MAKRLAGWNSDAGWNGFTLRTVVYQIHNEKRLVIIRLYDNTKKSIACMRYENTKTEDAVCIFYQDYIIPHLWN